MVTANGASSQAPHCSLASYTREHLMVARANGQTDPEQSNHRSQEEGTLAFNVCNGFLYTGLLLHL